ncbi:MAG: hypothetical protein E6K99_09975 [Thaumarchaeota archaeon]|nr:MAG: hypothetical protein E6K99_09975 [Nitrososphaerota archaeon]
MAKRGFTIDTGSEKIDVEGHEHKNVAVKYLMKRGKQVSKDYDVKWEKVSTGEFAGAKFTFTLEEAA